MFTGIVEEVGTIISFEQSGESAKIKIACSKVLEDTELGDSIAVNGICLTVTSIQSNCFTADVMPQTIRMTSLKECRIGSRVNLERAMRADGRFGGHIVSGHIDGVGTIMDYKREGNAIWMTIHASHEIMELILLKGSVAIDGVSLTVARKDSVSFAVSLIPTTAKETILLQKGIGSCVNLENDVIGKYVKQLLYPHRDIQSQEHESHLTMEMLEAFEACGF